MRTERLGDVAEFVRGVSFDGSETLPRQSTGYLPILRAGNIQDRLDLQSDLIWVPEGRVSAEQRMIEGDLAICMSSGSSSVVGKSAILDRRFDGSVGAFCAIIRPGAELDSSYLAHWLRSPAFLGWRDAQSRGASIQNLRLSHLAKIVLPLPPLHEQRRLAARLTREIAQVHAIRTDATTVRDRTSDLARRVRDDAFAQLEADQAPLATILPIPGAIIDGPFGSNLKGDHYKTSGVRVIRLGNIGLGRFIDVDRAYVTEEHYATLVRHTATPGDVVVAALGDGARPAGRACVVPDELVVSIVKADCFRIRTNGSSLDAHYLMEYMNSTSVLRQVAASTRGATRPRMTLAILKQIDVPLPPLDTQRRIAAQVQRRLAIVDLVTAAVDAKVEAIEALSAALLRRAFDEMAA